MPEDVESHRNDTASPADIQGRQHDRPSVTSTALVLLNRQLVDERLRPGRSALGEQPKDPDRLVVVDGDPQVVVSRREAVRQQPLEIGRGAHLRVGWRQCP